MKTIERIYITKGDNVYDSEGRTCDKAWGIKVNGKVYWCDSSFATIEQLEWKLNSLGVMVSNTSRGAKWGQLEDDGDGRKVARVCNPITRINKHQDDVFSSESGYIKKAIKDSEGSYWWRLSDLVKLIKEQR